MHTAWRNARRSLKPVLRAGFRVVLFACVCVSVWQGPLPWLHRHTDVGPNGDASHLAEHVQSWHSRELQPGDWHLHFALLGDILRGEGDPIPPTKQEEEQSQELFAQTVALIEQAPLSRLGWLSAPAEFFVPAIAPPRAIEFPPNRERASPRQFLSNFAVSGSLEALLCTAQC